MTPGSNQRAARTPRATALSEVTASLEALGLDPAEALTDIAETLRLYGSPSALSSIYRELMLQWFGSSDHDADRVGPLRREDVVEVAVRMCTLDVPTAYPIEKAAALLGETELEVTRRIERSELWASGRNRNSLPAWQFLVSEGKAEVISQHLATIVSAIPRNAPPALVRGLMTLDDPQLSRNRGEATSPRNWLIGGHGPLPVVAILLRYLEGNDDRLLTFMWGAAELP